MLVHMVSLLTGACMFVSIYKIINFNYESFNYMLSKKYNLNRQKELGSVPRAVIRCNHKIKNGEYKNEYYCIQCNTTNKQ